MLVSSANNINSTKSDTLLKSLMYNKNNNGPRIDPWGTPHEINLENELENTLCFRQCLILHEYKLLIAC